MEKMNLRHERNICAWFNLQNFQKITGNYHNSYAPQSFQDMIKVTCKAIYFKIFRMLNVINKRARTAVVVAVAVAAKLNNMKVRTKLKLIYTFFFIKSIKTLIFLWFLATKCSYFVLVFCETFLPVNGENYSLC